MVTKKNNKKNENVTKVICQNCGAEIVISQHECAGGGVAIGQDSGLGTVVLPTKGGARAHTVNPLEALQMITGGSSEMLETVASLINQIEESGYLDVDGIVRRWIPSQCLAMVYSQQGFHEALKSRGYDYTWKVLVEDLRKQYKLYLTRDTEGWAERNRWYNGTVAYWMANHYSRALRCYIANLSQHTHKGRPYVKLVCHLNNGKGVYVDEVKTLLDKVESLALHIKACKTPKTLYENVLVFDNFRKKIKFTPYDFCGEFFNAYKAAGAYYTIKDLIMFEGCYMQTSPNGSTDQPSYYDVRNGVKRKFVATKESLIALENKASQIVREGVADSGYMMLGLLKDFLEYNNFNVIATRKKWAEQSKIRKALRVTKRGNRRTR